MHFVFSRLDIRVELKENVDTLCGRKMSTLEIMENGQGLPMSKIESLFDFGHPAEEHNAEESLFGNFGHGANQVGVSERCCCCCYAKNAAVPTYRYWYLPLLQRCPHRLP